MSVVDLLPVKHAALDLALANIRLQEAIRAARHDGASLREIAMAAGVSYETVRRIAG